MLIATLKSNRATKNSVLEGHGEVEVFDTIK